MKRIPVHIYRHRTSGRTVTLVGMAHIGDARYFHRARALLLTAEARGAEVHYEGVIEAPVEMDAAPLERELAARLRRAMKQLNAEMAELLGLDLQHSLELEPHWRRTDLNTIEMLREFDDPEAFVRKTEEFAEVTADIPRPVLAVLRVAVHLLPIFAPLLGLIPSTTSRALGPRRDRVAVDAALATPGDVIALWGAAHLRGIGKGLTAAGFRRVRSIGVNKT